LRKQSREKLKQLL